VRDHDLLGCTRDAARAQERKARDAEVKKQAAQLKKLGLIYQTKDLRKVKVTSYMRKKVNQLSGVLTGDAVVLLPPKGKKARDFKGDDDIIATPNGRVFRSTRASGTRNAIACSMSSTVSAAMTRRCVPIRSSRSR